MSDEKTKHPAVSTYMETHSGRALGIDLGNVRVLVQPQGKDAQARVEEIAGSIADSESRFSALKSEIERADRRIAELLDRAERAESRLSHQRAINEAAISGKRRFFSSVLMTPKTPGDWSGEVWLMDPVKQMKGNALRFASLAEVRAEHPELWVTAVATTVDGVSGVLLDAWGGK